MKLCVLIEVTLLAALASGCASTGLGTMASTSEEAAIRNARVAQNEAIRDGAFDEVAQFWTNDITVRAGLGFPLVGRAAYREAFSADTTILYVRNPENILVSHDWPLAWEHGTWAGSSRSSGEPLISGEYSAQWIKLDGGWKIRSELFVALHCSGLGCHWPVMR